MYLMRHHASANSTFGEIPSVGKIAGWLALKYCAVWYHRPSRERAAAKARHAFVRRWTAFLNAGVKNNFSQLETLRKVTYVRTHMASLSRLLQVVFLLLALATPALPQMSPAEGPDPIQDRARVLGPPALRDMRALIANDSRPIRLLIVVDRKPYGGVGSFTEYVDALAQNWGIDTRPLAILVVHEIKTKNITVRLGQGFSRHDRRRAHAIINDVYKPTLRYQLFNAAHPLGLAALTAQLPRAKSSFREKPFTPIPLTDNGAVIQDHIGTLSTKQIAALSTKLAARSHKGQMVRLVMIQRHQDLSTVKLLRAFTRNLAIQWGMQEQHNSVLLVFDAQRNTVVLRLGYGFSPQLKLQANQVLTKQYKRLLQQSRFDQAHQTGMMAVLKVLGKQPVTQPITQPGGTPYYLTLPQYSPPKSRLKTPRPTDPLISPPPTGDLVQDNAGVLTQAAIQRLNDLIKGFVPASIRILTVKNYRYRSNSKDFQSYANSLMHGWQLDLTPNAILIVHDINSKQIAVAFNPNYSAADQTYLRAPLQAGYGVGLKAGLINAAHIMGVERLMVAFYTPVAPSGLKTKLSAQPDATPPTSGVGKVMAVIAVLMTMLAVVVIYVILSHRNTTSGARTRADRIAAWKRADTAQKTAQKTVQETVQK